MGRFHAIANDQPLHWIEAMLDIDLVSGTEVQYTGEPLYIDGALATNHETGFIALSLDPAVVSLEVWFRPQARGKATAILTGTVKWGVAASGQLTFNDTRSDASVDYDNDNQLVIQYGTETQVYLNGVLVAELSSSDNQLPAGQSVHLGVELLSSGRVHNCLIRRVMGYDHVLSPSAFTRPETQQRLAFTSYASLDALRADYHALGDLVLNDPDGLITGSVGYVESQWLEVGQTLVLLDHIQANPQSAPRIEFREDLTVLAFGEVVDLEVDEQTVLQVRFDDRMRLHLFKSHSESRLYTQTEGRYSMRSYLMLLPESPVATLPLNIMHGEDPLLAPIQAKTLSKPGHLPIWWNSETRPQANPYGFGVRNLAQQNLIRLVHRTPDRHLFQVAQGYIADRVTINGLPAPDRRVLCYLQYGDLITETRSDKEGNSRFDNLLLARRYMIVAQDKPEYGEAEYNAVAADFQQPQEYA